MAEGSRFQQLPAKPCQVRLPHRRTIASYPYFDVTGRVGVTLTTPGLVIHESPDVAVSGYPQIFTPENGRTSWNWNPKTIQPTGQSHLCRSPPSMSRSRNARDENIPVANRTPMKMVDPPLIAAIRLPSPEDGWILATCNAHLIANFPCRYALFDA
jgi:hypothetical protein